MNTSTPNSRTCPQTLPVVITGAGVYAATGDLGFALFAAVATRLCCGCPTAGLFVPAAGQGVAQPYSAPIAALPLEMNADIRIPFMAGQALTGACAFLPSNPAGLRVLVLTLLPAASPERPQDSGPDRASLAEELRSTHPTLVTAEIRFAPVDTGAAVHLAACIKELHHGKWDAVLFGGVDSLIDHATILALASRGYCRTDRNAEGTLSGEGAAYLLLQLPDKASPAMAVIAGVGYDREENHGKAADRQMTALASVIQEALDQGQCSPDRLETIVEPMGSSVPAALEWHQVRRKLWLTPENINLGMEELSPLSIIGDTGAAALPLALVIGCSRFEFNFPSVESVLVCEGDQGPARGAVLLMNNKKPTQETNPRKARV
jgi:3-oxoacyl-[acyl-carrier-protein] synthase-1